MGVPDFVRIPTCYGITYSHRTKLLLSWCYSRESQGGYIKRSFALRLQRVDGRRFDAFVADLLCSRLHGGAAPIISYVSAPLVRVRVRVRASFVCACARRRRVCVDVPDFVRVWVHASPHEG